MNGQKHLLIEYLYYTLFFITCQEKNNFKNGIIVLKKQYGYDIIIIKRIKTERLGRRGKRCRYEYEEIKL